jgi:FkbM family methyltransferase
MVRALESLRHWTRDVRRVLAYRVYNWPEFPPEPELEGGTTLSYSAFGEDLVAIGWLTEAGVKAGDIRYVDVGASDPVVLSNTMLMYRRGARGVLVEPDPEMAEKLKARRARDIVINAAVAFDERRIAPLIRLSSNVFNTFSEKQAADIVASSLQWDKAESVVGKINVELIPINDIVDRNLRGATLHFLSIDAEGVDFEIAQSLDLGRIRPWIVCMEKSRPLSELEELFRAHRYRIICETPHNVMFARDPLPAKGPRGPSRAQRYQEQTALRP